MIREPRDTSQIQCAVVHVNVGPEEHHGAAGLAKYLEGINAGYHVLTDDTDTVVLAQDNQRVWGASGMNTRGLHGCIIGRADQTPEQWMDPYSQAAMQRMAVKFGEWCKKYDLPVRRLSPQSVANGVKGICGHVDVERSGLPNTGGMSGHYDPGPNFPWAWFLDRVRIAVAGGQPADNTGDDMKPTDKVCARRTGVNGGVYVLQADGGVEARNGAPFFGSVPGEQPNPPTLVMGKDHAVSMALAPEGKGYWILLLNGAVHSFPNTLPYHGNFVGRAGFGMLEIFPDGKGSYIAVANDGSNKELTPK